MFYKILNLYKIFTFDSKKYDEIIKRMQESRGYVSHVNMETNTARVNPRYDRFTRLKQIMYTKEVPKQTKSLNPDSLYAFAVTDEFPIEKINQVGEKYGIDDDYEYKREFIEVGSGHQAYVIQHLITPIESKLAEMALDADVILDGVNYRYLSKNFFVNNYRRFFLLPFLAKYHDKYVEPVVICNVYDVGIITLQLIVSFEEEKAEEAEDTNPVDITFEEVKFYKKQSSYKESDFWEKESKKNVNISSIPDYYCKLMEKIFCVPLFSDDKFSQISWVFADLRTNKNIDHEEFIRQNKRFYVGSLKNTVKEYIERFDDETLISILNETSVFQQKGIHLFCTPVTKIISFGSSFFQKQVIEELKEYEQVLKKERQYEKEMVSLYKDYVYHYSFEYLRFYELTFIKKFFTIKLLNDLSTGNFVRIEDYNKAKKDLNFLLLKYDEDILFQLDGSPKELYKKLLKNSGAADLLEKVEKRVKDVRETVDQHREFGIKRTESFILILTSFLTVTLGYTGIKTIVADFLSHIPIIGSYIAAHNLRTTVAIWAVLVAFMIYLNTKRYNSMNKKFYIQEKLPFLKRFFKKRNALNDED